MNWYNVWYDADMVLLVQADSIEHVKKMVENCGTPIKIELQEKFKGQGRPAGITPGLVTLSKPFF